MFSGLFRKFCHAYIDDIIIFSKTLQYHNEKLRVVLKRLQDAKLKVKPEKCKFAYTSVLFLGHVVNNKGISPDPSKTDEILKWPTPIFVNKVRNFLGVSNYYRRFIKNYSTTATPLNRLLEANHQFKWTTECENSFVILKNLLTTTPILVFPNFKKHFTLDCDASDTGLNAVLPQLDDNNCKHPIAYYSRSLSKQERRYSTTRKELLAFVNFVNHFRCYLLVTILKCVLTTPHCYGYTASRNQLAKWCANWESFLSTTMTSNIVLEKPTTTRTRYPDIQSIPQRTLLAL